MGNGQTRLQPLFSRGLKGNNTLPIMFRQGGPSDSDSGRGCGLSAQSDPAHGAEEVFNKCSQNVTILGPPPPRAGFSEPQSGGSVRTRSRRTAARRVLLQLTEADPVPGLLGLLDKETYEPERAEIIEALARHKDERVVTRLAGSAASLRNRGA